jgi:hypothetical protein
LKCKNVCDNCKYRAYNYRKCKCADSGPS